MEKNSLNKLTAEYVINSFYFNNNHDGILFYDYYITQAEKEKLLHMGFTFHKSKNGIWIKKRKKP